MFYVASKIMLTDYRKCFPFLKLKISAIIKDTSLKFLLLVLIVRREGKVSQISICMSL